MSSTDLPSARKGLPAPLLALGLVVLWLVVLNVVGLNTWGHGPLTFFMLLALVALMGLARWLGPQYAAGGPRAISITVAVLAAAAATYFLVSQLYMVRNPETTDPKSDIALNTWTAGTYAFDYHLNPYTSRAQTGHDVSRAPNVDSSGPQLTMFGVPYYYGYPYFPAMFLSYEPFRRMDQSPSSVRTGNAVYYGLVLVAIGWLTALLAPRGTRLPAALLSVAGFACVVVMGKELFDNGVTDIVIPLFAILGFIASYYGRHSLSGVLLGWTLAAKLVPGGLFLLIVSLWYLRRPERWKFLIPMAVTVLAVLLPYVLKDPGAFLSATVLFYMTEHARGDSTALWYTLPPALQPIFQILGYALIVGMIVWAFRRRSLGLLGVLALCFGTGIVFVAFNRMSHLNYDWAVVPLGCVTLVVYAMGGNPPVVAETSHPERA
ncbi:MAG: hypothetical protein QOJ65_2377 [Fimbriimonadaceae bacterium]|jgi:hypothetical protein|nr:hypothetical protein [Fimbriimonadaceae bacterium]